MNTWISFSSFSDELHKLAADKKVPLEKAEHKIFNALMRGAPVKVVINEQAAATGGGYFDQVKKEIHVSDKDYRILAHELGHAELDKHIIGRMLQSRVARVAHNLSPLAAVGAGILMAKGKKWGVLLPAALVAPTLASEAMASVKGHKKLEEAEGSDEQKQSYRRLMALAFGSYAITPVANHILAHIISKR